jgi:hypothetical protein
MPHLPFGKPQMNIKRNQLPIAQACSLALLASILLSTPSLSHAQNTTLMGPVFNGPASIKASTAIAPNRWTPKQLRQAFDATDGNLDGKLSRDEVSVWFGLSRRFDQIDADKDGSISSAEFEEALK